MRFVEAALSVGEDQGRDARKRRLGASRGSSAVATGDNRRVPERWSLEHGFGAENRRERLRAAIPGSQSGAGSAACLRGGK